MEQADEKIYERDALKRLVGSRIKSARLNAGLTQQQLLERMHHKTIESISNVERGSTLPPLDTLLDFARALEVDPGTLLTDLATERALKDDNALHEIRLMLTGYNRSELRLALRLLRAIREPKT